MLDRTPGLTVSKVIVLVADTFWLFAVSLMYTLYVFVPSDCDVWFLKQFVPDLVIVVLVPSSNRQISGLVSVNVTLT